MSVDPASLTILHYPAPQLRKRAKPLHNITDEVRAVVKRMIELMKEAEGVGLAAPQVGLPWRVFVTNIPDDQDSPRVFVNPEIAISGDERTIAEEGCLSLPGIHVEIERSKAVSISATDLAGNAVNLSSDEFSARVWQHEFDHLNGVLIIDKMSTMDRLATRRSLKELESSGSTGSSL